MNHSHAIPDNSSTLVIDDIIKFIYCGPCTLIFVFGITTNMLALITLSQRQLQKTKSVLNLRILAVLDTCVLFTGLITPIFQHVFHLNLRVILPGYCQWHRFTLFFFGDLAIWNMIVITVDRYLAIMNPLQFSRYFNHFKYVMAVQAGLVLLSLLKNFMNIIIKKLDRTTGNCVLIMKYNYYEHYARPMTSLSLYYLLPALTIIVLNSLIFLKLKRVERKENEQGAELYSIANEDQMRENADDDDTITEEKDDGDDVQSENGCFTPSADIDNQLFDGQGSTDTAADGEKLAENPGNAKTPKKTHKSSVYSNNSSNRKLSKHVSTLNKRIISKRSVSLTKQRQNSKLAHNNTANIVTPTVLHKFSSNTRMFSSTPAAIGCKLSVSISAGSAAGSTDSISRQSGTGSKTRTESGSPPGTAFSRMILAITITFLIFLTPSMIIWTLLTYQRGPLYGKISVSTLKLLFAITDVLAYTHHGINFWFYLIMGRMFRRTLFQVLRCKHGGVKNTSESTHFRMTQKSTV